ncbi:MAG: hypothetical protein LAN62_07940 [Acidobacteriia bacterium]|nr:hypothetical protein [Terriglobia bacterium]
MADLGFTRAKGIAQPAELNMSYMGKVTKGTVVLPPGVTLPEGTAVRIEPVKEEPLAKRLKHVIGSVEGLPPDFAENHDHYIHGTPKK